MKSTRFATLAVALLSWHGAHESPAAEAPPLVTIYSTAPAAAVEPLRTLSGPESVPGYALVQERITLQAPDGTGQLRYAGVPAAIDPTTVRFQSLTDPQARVLEQKFRFDLADEQNLLRQAIGRRVEVERLRGGEIFSSEGRLRAVRGALVLERDDGTVEVIQSYDTVRLLESGGRLATQPTLVWQVRSAAGGGAHEARVTYETRGLTWWAEYDVTLGQGTGCRLDFDGWATLVNLSGADFEGARVRLVAGDPHRARTSPGAPVALMESRAADRGAAAGWEQRALGDHQLYVLDRTADIPSGTLTQMRLLPEVAGVPCERQYVFDALQGRWPQAARPLLEPRSGFEGASGVRTVLAFANAREHGLGEPLPGGRVRVSESDAGASVFIGEDVIGHTAPGERLRLQLGTAFGLRGERRQIDFRIDNARNVLEEEIQIELHNGTAEPVTIAVDEHLYRWSNWEITTATAEFERLDAATVRFPVHVPAGGQRQLRYRVRYTW